MGFDRGGELGPQRFELGHVLTYSGAAARRRRFEDTEDAARAPDVDGGAARIGAAAGALALNFPAGAAVEELASVRHRTRWVSRPDGTGKGRVHEREPPAGIPRPHRRRKRLEEGALRVRIGLLFLQTVGQLSDFLLETAHIMESQRGAAADR